MSASEAASGSGSFCVGCGADGATMQCPKCKELGLSMSLFCNQACFKANWTEHREKHRSAKSGSSTTKESSSSLPTSTATIPTMSAAEQRRFHFTGKLRPGLITPKRKVPAKIEPTAEGEGGSPKLILRPDYADEPQGFPASEEMVINSNRVTKWTGKSLEKIKRVAALSREVLDEVIAAVKPGITTDSLDEVCHKATVARGMYPSPLNYRGFPKSICTSINEVICHGIPDDTILNEGDIVNLDVSCYFEGFHGDLNETVFVGKPREGEDGEVLVKLVHTAYQAMMAGINCVKPGEMYKHIGDVVTPVATAQGFSVVRSVCGHGIGSLFHTAPNIPHYNNNKTPGVMQEGHVFTIEPMINEGTWHDVIWPDNWTITTRDGKRSAQFEHTMVCTKDGAEILTPYKDGVPHYQKQLAEWGIPLPEVANDDDDWGTEEDDSEDEGAGQDELVKQEIEARLAAAAKVKSKKKAKR